MERIRFVLLVTAVALYFLVAWAKYAEDKWRRGCTATSYAQICLYIFPDNIPFTKLVWAPDFIHHPCERAREAHRAKLADMLLKRAKTLVGEGDYAKFFYAIFGATQLDPKNTEARVMASNALFSLGRDEDAMAALEESLPGLLADQEFIQGYLLTSLGKARFARVLGVANHYITQPDTPTKAKETFMLAAAHCHFERGEFKACERLLANREISASRDALLLRARILQEYGKVRESSDLLKTAMRFNASDTALSQQLIALHRDAGDEAGSRSAALSHLQRSGKSSAARITLLKSLNARTDRARIETEIAAYRSAYRGDASAMRALCEYASHSGRFALCADLSSEAETRSNPHAKLMYLLYIESHLVSKHYEQALRLLDELFLEPPVWLTKHRLRFDAIRMVAHFALRQEDLGEIGFKRIYECDDHLEPPFMEEVAQHLIDAGRPGDAIRIIDLCRKRNRDSVEALAAQVRIHLLTGGTPDTPQRIREYIAIKRPPRPTLLRMRQVIAGDAYFFDETQDKLISDVELLIQGISILPPVAPIPPKRRADR